MKWKKFISALDSANIVFVHDDRKNGRIDGLLRSLPLFLYRGFSSVTCPKSWLQVNGTQRHKLMKYNWRLSEEITEPDGNLIVATTQYYENKFEVFSIRSLVNRYADDEATGTLVVIGNDRNFRLSQTVRPLRDQPIVNFCWNVSDVVNVYHDRYRENSINLPLADTKNQFLQDNAVILNRFADEPVQSLRGLLNALSSAPYLPVVQSLSSIFSRREGFGARRLETLDEVDELSKWLRRRMELDRDSAREISLKLNDFARKDERLYSAKGRRKMKSLREAVDRIDECIPPGNPILERYRNWLSQDN
jgi:hypothetical protein